MLDLKGKTAFVTGAGSVGEGWGNGKATAVLLARQGARVYGLDLNPDAVAVTKGLVEKEGGTIAVRTCNMAKSEEVAAAVADCLARFGGIDILVNNVGGSAPGDPVTMSEEVWDAQMDQNLKSVFLGCKHVIPVMLEKGRGAIVNLSSVAAYRMSEDRAHVAYSATKLGIVGFSKSVAISYAKKGIRCNTVVPGLMHTPLVEHRLAKTIAGGDVAALVAKRNAQVPLGKMGDAWDVAHAVLFLVSEEARHITGSEIFVDGGITAGR